MKKLLLPIFLVFVSLLVFVDQAIAQSIHPPDASTKKISCEELYDIALSKVDTCKLADLTFEGYVWCAENQAEFDNYRRNKLGLSLYYEELVPSYTYDFDRGQCFESWAKKEGKLPSVSEPSKSSFVVNEPDFLEEFRKLLEVLSNPRKVIEKARKQGVSQAKIEEMVTPELLTRLPYITPDDEQKVWDSLTKFTSSAQNDIIVVKGKIKVKSPTLDDFIQVVPEGKPISVTFIDAVVTGSDSEPTQVGYLWGPDAGAVISLPQSTEIELGVNTRSVKLNQGEVEVKIQNNDPQNPFNVHSGSLTVVAPRTHFWVSQNPGDNQTVVGVYKGEVQVTTQDGQTTSIAPSGDKPGVVVITQKLSSVKLSLAGLVVIAVLGGIVLILRKRLVSNLLKKKK